MDACTERAPLTAGHDVPVVHVDDPAGVLLARLPLGLGVRLDAFGVVTSLGGGTFSSLAATRLLGQPLLRAILPHTDVSALEEHYRAGVADGLVSMMFAIRFHTRDRSPLVTVALFYSSQLGCGWAFAREGKNLR